MDANACDCDQDGRIERPAKKFESGRIEGGSKNNTRSQQKPMTNTHLHPLRQPATATPTTQITNFEAGGSKNNTRSQQKQKPTTNTHRHPLGQTATATPTAKKTNYEAQRSRTASLPLWRRTRYHCASTPPSVKPTSKQMQWNTWFIYIFFSLSECTHCMLCPGFGPFQASLIKQLRRRIKQLRRRAASWSGGPALRTQGVDSSVVLCFPGQNYILVAPPSGHAGPWRGCRRAQNAHALSSSSARRGSAARWCRKA